MRIIVAGAGFANKGAEAMTRTLFAELGRRVPGLEVLLWDCPESQAAPALDMGLVPLLRPSPGGRLGKIGWLAGRVGGGGLKPSQLDGPLAMWLTLSAEPMLDAAGQFDAFVDISGFAYGDTWGPGPALSVLPVTRLAAQRSLPVVFMPQAWGAFDKPKVRESVLGLTGGPKTLVFSRDPRSTRHLESAGLTAGSIATRSDIVFAFEGGTAADGRALLRAMGCDLERPLVGVAPNMRVYERSEGVDARNEYVRMLVALVRHCTDRHEVDVVLLPSECAPVDRGTDDRRLCALVRDEARRDSRCHTSAGYVTADGTRALVGRCDYLVGSRFHALVFALSQGVPCTALGWSHKYRELMELFESADDCLGHEEASEAAVIGSFDAGWRDRDVGRARRLQIAGALRADVRALFDEVAAFLVHGRDAARVPDRVDDEGGPESPPSRNRPQEGRLLDLDDARE